LQICCLNRVEHGKPQHDFHPGVIGQFWERFAGRFAPRRCCNTSDRFTCQATSGQRSTVKPRPRSSRPFCCLSRATFHFTFDLFSLLTFTQPTLVLVLPTYHHPTNSYTMGASSLLPLVVLFAIGGGIAWVGYQVSMVLRTLDL
jgi:hypothetical protein